MKKPRNTPAEATAVGRQSQSYMTTFNELSRWSKYEKVGDDYLIATLDGIGSARTILVEDAQRMITLIFAVLTGAAALVYFGIDKDRDKLAAQLIFTLSTVVFWVVPLLCLLARQKIRNAYEFYVSAALHATIVHRSKGMGDGHQWMMRIEELITDLDKESGGKGVSLANFHGDVILKWMKAGGSLGDRTSPNLLQAYLPLLFLTALISTVCGLYVMIYCMYKYDIFTDVFITGSAFTEYGTVMIVFLPIAIAVTLAFQRLFRA